MLIAWSRCSISEFRCNRKAKTRERRDTSFHHRSQRLRRFRRPSAADRGRICGARAGPPGQSARALGRPWRGACRRRSPRPDSIRAALAGCRYVFHVAADYRFWARDKNDIFDLNVTGTRIVMEEALRAGAERVIYTSSVAALALPAPWSPGRKRAALPGRANRNVQAQQDRRRAPGAGDGGRTRLARSHRQSLDADRVA